MILCAGGVAACGSLSSAAAVAPRPTAPAVSSRDCTGQRLSCEQLVQLGLTYPYPRQPSSYLYVDGAAYPYVDLRHRSLANGLVEVAGEVLTARRLLMRLALGSQASVARTPVIAYGSNANVDALNRKFLTSDFSGPAVIPVVKATLYGFDVAWSPEFVFNGAMPATIVGSPGTGVGVWVTWLDAAELKEMNATEGVGTLYSYGLIDGARLDAPGPTAMQPGLYVDCFGALRVGAQTLAIRAVPAHHRRFAADDSVGALSRVGPAIGWRGSVFELLLDNVRHPEQREIRSRKLQALGVQLPEPGYVPIDRCAAT